MVEFVNDHTQGARFIKIATTVKHNDFVGGHKKVVLEVKLRTIKVAVHLCNFLFSAKK